MRAFEIPAGGILLDGNPRLDFIAFDPLTDGRRKAFWVAFSYRIVIVLLVNCLPIDVCLPNAFLDTIKADCSMMKAYDCGEYVGSTVLVWIWHLWHDCFPWLLYRLLPI